jgi:major structural subunit of bundle-forming pilus
MRNILADIRRRRQQGLTLIEAAMVLAIAALVVAGVMLFFQNANNAQKTNDAMGELAAIQQVVRSLYSGQPDYTGLNAALLANSKQLPNKMIVGVPPAATGLQDPFNATITVTPVAVGGVNSQFSVEFDGLSIDACSKMATVDLGTSLVSIAVNGQAATNGTTLTPGQANTQCNVTGNGSKIVWTFY